MACLGVMTVESTLVLEEAHLFAIGFVDHKGALDDTVTGHMATFLHDILEAQDACNGLVIEPHFAMVADAIPPCGVPASVG